MEVQITHLVHHPVKAVKGNEVSRLFADRSGVVSGQGLLERQYVIIDENEDPNGVHNFVSSRDKISPDSPSQSMGLLTKVAAEERPGRLHFTYDGKDPYDLPIDIITGEKRVIRIHQTVITGAVDQGDGIREWLSDLTSGVRGLRLVKVDPKLVDRKMSTDYCDDDIDLGGQDGYPMNWLDERGVARFNEFVNAYYGREMQPFLWDALRPNIVTNGFEDKEFYQIMRASIGLARLKNVKLNPRCTVPNVRDGRLGEIDFMKVLSNSPYHWKDAKSKVRPVFAWNTVAERAGWLEVGMKVNVTQNWEPRIIVGTRDQALGAPPAQKAA